MIHQKDSTPLQLSRRTHHTTLRVLGATGKLAEASQRLSRSNTAAAAGQGETDASCPLSTRGNGLAASRHEAAGASRPFADSLLHL